MTDRTRLGIVGAGAWGTALAVVAARAGRTVRLWAREPSVRAALAQAGENGPFLPGIKVPREVAVTGAWADLRDCTALLWVVPAQHLRASLAAYAPHHPPGQPAVLCAKGIERTTGRLMTEVLAETLPDAPPAVLSGPSFARDVAAGLPTAVTLACPDAELGRMLVAALGQPGFRPYLSGDMIGAEIGGAVKNVLAIACGIADGRGLGDSARAALITRGFAEMSRFGRALGAEAETLAGLSGLGDLVLTCSSRQSRNFALGRALGEGRRLAEIEAARHDVAEGVATAPALVARAQGLGVEMPIAMAVAAVLAGTLSLEAAIAGLLSRPFRTEGD